MISASTDSLLKGLGCNMTEKAPKDLFPEECLVQVSSALLKDPKALKLCWGALKKHQDLLHPEMLLKFLNNESTEPNVIGALLLKLNHRRFSKIVDHCKKAKFKSEKPSKILQLAAKIGQTNYDIHFKAFGLDISELENIDTKKISSLEHLTKNNIFYKNRLLFGSNWRADIISCIQKGEENPSQIKKRLHCSYETAHRVFSDYSKFMEVAGNLAV